MFAAARSPVVRLRLTFGWRFWPANHSVPCAFCRRGENEKTLPLMKFETYLLLAVVVFFVWKTNRSVQISRTAQERHFVLRTSIFTWFVGFLLLAALLFLPFKALVLLSIPAVFGVLSLSRFLRDARNRLRQAEQGRVDLERMKRINPVR